MMPTRAKRISASTTNKIIMTIGLSPLPPHLNRRPKLVIPNPPSQQTVVGGKQLQQSPVPAPGPGQGVGT